MLSKFLTKRPVRRATTLAGGKIAFIILFFFLVSSFLSKPTLAFYTPNTTYQFQFEQAVYGTPQEMNLQSFVYETMKAVVGSVATTIACLSCTPEQRRENPGLVMTVGNLLAAAYANPPASGVQYLAYLKEKIGLATPAYAQDQEGVGFSAMINLLPVWKKFRDISYGFLVLILIFLGFAVMFRIKISPQAVITIQSALPRIVIALILITFSYAIVGFLLDLMFLLYVLMIKIFATLPLVGDWKIQNLITWIDNNILGLFGRQLSLGAQATITGFFAFLLIPALAFLFLLFLGPVGWVLAILIAILLLVTIVRCAFTLLKAYAMIIIHLIFAPFEILIGALPGSGATGAWFKNLLANIAVLPAMMTMFFLSSYLIFVGIKGIFRGVSEIFIEFLELITIGWIPGREHIWDKISKIIGGGFAGGAVTYWQFISAIILPLVGVGILFMAPKVTDMIQSFIAGKPFGYGAAIGEVFGPIILAGGLTKEAGVSWVKGYAAEKGKIAAGARAAREEEITRVSRPPPAGKRAPRGSRGPSA